MTRTRGCNARRAILPAGAAIALAVALSGERPAAPASAASPAVAGSADAPLRAGGAGTATRRAESRRRTEVIGRSVLGRPIRALRVGDPHAARRVLVVGCMHGNECAGRAVTTVLARRPAPAGVQLWIVHDLNPDGSRARTRQNARGVDLNRNFPRRWRRMGSPGSVHYSGRRPLSEPETRAAVRLIRRIRPDATIWYHQALALIDLSSGADSRLVRRYARISRLPARRIDRLPGYGRLPGVATAWQNHRFPGTSAFVAELPAGALPPAALTRHVRAVRAVAALVRRIARDGGRGRAS